MNKNLNLVEILKDCPRGTKLYYTVYGEVEFDHVAISSKYPIVLKLKGGEIYESLTSEGKYDIEYDGECLLFPSKDQRDWSKFNPKKDWFVPPCEFKDGDILSYQCKGFNNRSIYIYRYHKRFNTSYYVALSGDDNEFRIDNTGKWALNGYNDTVRFATEDEKKKLFQAIKDNGYKWNAETKTLEKLIKPKFDPKTLQPFDRVLVKVGSCWRIEWFSHMYEYKGDIYYSCSWSDYKECIPYNDETKHLLGTSEEAPEYYRYWED